MREPKASNATAHSASLRKSAEIHSLLKALISKREQEIAEIEQMVERYERRLRIEEQAYRTMSTLRRMITGKRPDHHLAVEYIHYVKKPMEKVRMLRNEISKYQGMLDGTVPTDLTETI
jgi:hypothetical protein